MSPASREMLRRMAGRLVVALLVVLGASAFAPQAQAQYLWFSQVPPSTYVGTSHPVTVAFGGRSGFQGTCTGGGDDQFAQSSTGETTLADSEFASTSCEYETYETWNYYVHSETVRLYVNGGQQPLSFTQTGYSCTYWENGQECFVDYAGQATASFPVGSNYLYAEGYCYDCSQWYTAGYSFSAATPSATVAVSDGAYRRVEPNQSLSQAFQVTNTGNTSVAYNLAISCPGAAGCSLGSSQISVNAGQTVEVSGYYTAGAPNTTGTVTLTASHSSSIGSWQDAGSVSFEVNSYAVAVTPDGQVQTHEPVSGKLNPIASSTAFFVRNNGNLSVPYQVALSCPGFVSCTFDATQTRAATVSPAAGGGTSSLSVSYQLANTPGTQGTLTATASYTTPTGTVVSDAGTVTAVVARYEVTVIAQTLSVKEDVGRRAVSYVVTNTGTTSSQIRLNAACSGGAASCTNSSSGGSSEWFVTLNVNQTTSQTVYYNANSPGSTGTISLTATPVYYPSAARTGTSSLTVNSYAVAVTPDGEAVRADAGTSPTQAFKVKNLGNATSTYNFSRTCTGAATNCGASPAAVTLGAGDSSLVPSVTYTAGTAGTTGSVTLQATSTNTTASFTDQGSVALTVNNYQPAVWATASTATVDVGTGRTHTFWVRNVGNTSALYNFTPDCSGTGVAAGCTASKTLGTLVSSDSTSVVVTYQAQNPGATGTVTLRASYAGNTAVTHLATATITVKSYTVVVTPDDSLVRGDQQMAKTTTFRVLNTGNTTAAYALSSSCGGSQTGCSRSPAGPITVSPGATGATVNVTYTPPLGTAGQTKQIVLTASNATYGVQDGGSARFVVNRYGVAVVSQGVADTTVHLGGRSQRFTVSNTGNTRATYYFTAGCASSPVFSTCSTVPATAALDSGATTTVTVNYTTQLPLDTGTIHLTASNKLVGGNLASATGSRGIRTYGYGHRPHAGESPGGVRAGG